MGIALEPGDSENVASIVADVSTGPSETIDLNWTEGDFNLQDNDFVLRFTSEDARSLLQQSLLGLSFNRVSAELANARMHNTLNADISAPDGVEGTVGVNAAAGAFNMQKNAAATAIVPGRLLASSSAGIGQDAVSNLSVHHDAINDVTAIIPLNKVTGNVGINLASGVGRRQRLAQHRDNRAVVLSIPHQPWSLEPADRATLISDQDKGQRRWIGEHNSQTHLPLVGRSNCRSASCLP